MNENLESKWMKVWTKLELKWMSMCTQQHIVSEVWDSLYSTLKWYNERENIKNYLTLIKTNCEKPLVKT